MRCGVSWDLRSKALPLKSIGGGPAPSRLLSNKEAILNEFIEEGVEALALPKARDMASSAFNRVVEDMHRVAGVAEVRDMFEGRVRRQERQMNDLKAFIVVVESWLILTTIIELLLLLLHFSWTRKSNFWNGRSRRSAKVEFQADGRLQEIISWR